MGELTEIAWTDHTFNPWIGCSRVSPGCQNCYAEARDRRYGEGLWGKDAPRRVTSDHNWRQPVKWNEQAKAEGRRHRVFCASLADVFEDREDLAEPRARLFALIMRTPWLDWQLLTKRPENVARLTPWAPHFWPDNVWIGTTVEDQQRADERIPILLDIPARVRFLSCEPLIGPVNLTAWIDRVEVRNGYKTIAVHYVSQLNWIIVGGESGRTHRPLDLDHARRVRDHALLAEIPLFFKQVGGPTPKAGGHLLDGVAYQEFPR